MIHQAPRSREVFLSHSIQDKEWAEAACLLLEEHGLRCWIAPRDIVPGDEWGSAIIGGIAACEIMVLILSADANSSPHVRREVERAISKGMTVLPFRVEDVSPEDALAFALGNTQSLDGFTPPRGRQLEALVRAVEAHIGGGAPRRPTVAPPLAETRPTGRPRVTAGRLVTFAVGIVAFGAVAVAVYFPIKRDFGGPVAKPAAGTDEIVAATKQTPPPEPKAGGPSPKMDADFTTNSPGMKLKLIPVGEFEMGSDATDPDAVADEEVDGKKHHIRITRPFELGTTEVTVGQFRNFVERADYKTEAELDGKGGYGWDEGLGTFEQDPKFTWRSPGFPQSDDHPVVNVSWNDAVAFCDWLGQREGRTYRLPTEAEWEYACRAGTTTRYCSGDGPESLAMVGNAADATLAGKYANFAGNQGKDGYAFTAPAARLFPNRFRLFDMHGNVWEWCADWHDPAYYAKSPPADPPGPATGSLRVIRGGCWNDIAADCRSANRYSFVPTNRSSILGFRVARSR